MIEHPKATQGLRHELANPTIVQFESQNFLVLSITDEEGENRP